MKFSELKQAMDWRRRVGFNGGGYVKKKVLPQPKPKEEAEKVNKARKEKTFKEAKPALENPKEVKEMIDKPKRGLVDEPGSYSQDQSYNQTYYQKNKEKIFYFSFLNFFFGFLFWQNSFVSNRTTSVKTRTC